MLDTIHDVKVQEKRSSFIVSENLVVPLAVFS